MPYIVNEVPIAMLLRIAATPLCGTDVEYGPTRRVLGEPASSPSSRKTFSL